MSSAELPLTVAQIEQMEAGRPVAVFVGTITDVYEFKTNVGKNASDCQAIILTDPEGGKIRASCWNHPDYTNKKGAKVRIVSAFEKGRASTTVKMNTYYDPPHVELQVNKASVFLFAGSAPTNGATAAARQGAPANTRHTPAPVRPPVGAGAQRGQPPHAATGAKQIPVNGQTVGANVKLAVEVVLAGHPESLDGPLHEFMDTAEFSRRVWTVASDLIRVARRLEAGKLAPSALDRAGNQPEPDPQQEQAYEPEHEPQHEQEMETAAPRRNHAPGPEGAAFQQENVDEDVPF